MWINLERDGLGIVAFHLEGGSRVGSHQEPQVHGLNQKLNKTSGSRGGSTYAAVSAPLSYPDLRAYAHSDTSESSEIDYGTKLVVNLSCAACMWNERAGRQYIVCLQKLLIIFSPCISAYYTGEKLQLAHIAVQCGVQRELV
jgi:hypothetical protein